MGIAAAARFVYRAIAGEEIALPEELLARYPELGRARWRRGGLPVRVGGWCLGQKTVSAITLWHIIWLAPGAPFAEELLLHEVRHVEQFGASLAFPLLYLWESATRGYYRNRFEVDARDYASSRVRRQ
jgi:hypothetical protein